MTNSAATSAAEPAAKTDAAVTLELATWADVQKFIAAQKGKVVVVDLWSSACIPCVEEFPGLVKLQAAHPKDVVCVSVNCNYIGLGKPQDEHAPVLEFLQQNKARLKNYLSSEADEDLFKKVGIASIPVVQVFGRDGKIAKQFDNDNNEFGEEGFKYDKHIQPLVAKLLKGESGR